jgi:hypothetical protein
VSHEETDCFLGSEGNGVSIGKGGRGQPGPPERGKDKQSVPNKGRDNNGQGWGRPTKSDVMEEDHCEQSEQSSDQVEFCKCGH